jgi:hypothetical protein
VDTLLLSIAHLIELLCRLNVKLGGINATPEVDDVSFLTDSANPTIVMGRASSFGRNKATILIIFYFGLIRCRYHASCPWFG